MGLTRILSSEALPMYPNWLDNDSANKYTRDLHDYLRRQFARFTAELIDNTQEEEGGVANCYRTNIKWRKVYAVNRSSGSESWPTPTDTKPSGENIFAPLGCRILLMLFGKGAGGINADIYGWRKVSTTWVAGLLATITAATVTGLAMAGTDFDGTDLMASTYSFDAVGAYQNELDERDGSAFLPGHVSFPHYGSQLIEIQVYLAGGTDANGLYADI